jgi:hypothetical protein
MTRADPNAPIYILKLRPAPGSDHVKALRWALKILWRRFGLRCVSVEQEHGSRDTGGKP